MDYPQILLPNENYKVIDCNLDKFDLIRTFEKKEDLNIINECGHIELKYIADPTKHIADYSTNLFGHFEKHHICVTLTSHGKDIYNEYCMPNEIIETPQHGIHFELINNKEVFFIRIGSINNLTIEYEIQEEKFYGKCIIEHTPMKWNFWHFSIRWLNNENKYLHDLLDRELKKGWGRQLSSAAKAFLSEFAYLEEPNLNCINLNCFTIN